MTPHALTTNRRSALMAAAALLFLLALALTGCSKSYPNCDNDKNCAKQKEVCVDGKCRQCRDASQCQALDACLTCQANECVRIANCCKSDVDCPSGRCQDGVCGPQCSVNSDCPDGERCINGKCSIQRGCSADSDCSNGLRCRDGECSTECEIVTVYFDFNEYAVRLDQESDVQKNANCLKSSTAQTVTVEGHTDERGADEYNLALGERRAKSLAAQYTILGVKNVGRVVSFGEEMPLCTNGDEGCWRKNRRAETKVR